MQSLEVEADDLQASFLNGLADHSGCFVVQYRVHPDQGNDCSLILAGTETGSTADLGKALQEAMTREALLVKLTDQLRSRLAAYKQENAQLEELLHQADQRASGTVCFGATIRVLTCGRRHTRIGQACQAYVSHMQAGLMKLLINENCACRVRGTKDKSRDCASTSDCSKGCGVAGCMAEFAWACQNMLTV